MRGAALALVVTLVVWAAPAYAQPDGAAEKPVDPYVQSNANAGAQPIEGEDVFAALNGREGIQRIVHDLVARSTADPRIADIFVNHDLVRLRRTLGEQICYIAGGPCTYTGRTMAASHADMGVRSKDFNVLVEHLQAAMDREGVPFRAQNRLLAKLAPMHRDIVTP
ncbi:MAG: group 1 truncated hemoglobin [Hyphomonadaceae bacterium]|nr:group 1 truncated hemoglobin [Hyphomonadaceae bacterium]